MKKGLIISLLGICILLVPLVFVSCISDDSTPSNVKPIVTVTDQEQNAKITTLEAQEKALETRVGAVEKSVSTAGGAVTKQQYDEAMARISSLEASKTAMQTTITQLQADITTLKTTASTTTTTTSGYTTVGTTIIPATVTFGQSIPFTTQPTVMGGPSSGNIYSGGTYWIQIPAIQNNSSATRQIYIQANFTGQYGAPTAAAGSATTTTSSWITWTVTPLTGTGPWSWAVTSNYFQIGAGQNTGVMTLQINTPFTGSANWVQSWMIVVVN